MQEIVKGVREESGAGRRFHGIAQSHFLEGEEEVGARFDADGVRRGLGRPREERPELRGVEDLEPLLMRAFLVAALPLEEVSSRKPPLK